MNNQQLKNIWFYSNILLVANYTLLIVSKLVTIPIPRLPSAFNNLFLIAAYVFTFQSLLTNFKSYTINTFLTKVLSHSNTFCIFLFLTFPPNILLFPFYLLSIFHVVSTVLSKKQEYEKYFFYSICVSLQSSLVYIGRAALLSEAALSVVSFILFVMKKVSFYTLATYLAMIRMQYQTNKNMKDVVNMIVAKVHSLALKMPDSYKEYYFKLVNTVKSFKKVEDIKKKTE